ncbi:hypothetical protein F2P56_001292 [Juglans regia]|uniref:Uncharacterized protein n=1 Tax=Juglans regia TaxID=51240 RepID=A0A833YBQ9_JUGRE|nr:hypothetical protein F2P56_001292 [Juglans regia]
MSRRLHRALKDRPTPEVNSDTSVTDETKSRSVMSDEDWEDLDLRAASAIRLCLAKNVLANIHGISTAKELWEKLEELYQTKGVSNRVYLKELFHTLHISEEVTSKLFSEERRLGGGRNGLPVNLALVVAGNGKKNNSMKMKVVCWGVWTIWAHQEKLSKSRSRFGK